MSGQIRLVDDYVTASPNTAGQFTTVLEAEVPDNEKYFVPDGALAVIKLKNSAGEDISANSQILVGVKLPADDYPRKVDKKSYMVFNTLTLEKQYDDESNANCRIEIDQGGVVLKEQNKFLIDIKSPDVVDIDKSTIEINDVIKSRM